MANYPAIDPRVHLKPLTLGETVKLPEGQIVQPRDVCDPPDPSQAFAMLFIQDSSFVDDFVRGFKKTVLYDMRLPDPA